MFIMKEDDPTVLENQGSPVRSANANHSDSTMPSSSHQGGAWTPLKDEALRSTRIPSTPVDSDLDGGTTSPMQHLMASEEGTSKIRQSDDTDPDGMDHQNSQKQRRNLILMILVCVVLVVIVAAVVIPVLLLVVNGDKNTASKSSSASATNDPPVSVPVAVSPVSTNTSTSTTNSDAPSSMPHASNDTTSSDAPTILSNRNLTATPSLSPLFVSTPTVSNNSNTTTIAPTTLNVSTLVPTAAPVPMTTTTTSAPMTPSIAQENAAKVRPILQTFLTPNDYNNAVTSTSSATSVYAQSYEYMISSDTYLASATFTDDQVVQRYILIVLNSILKQSSSTATQIAIRVNPGSDHCAWIGIVCNTNTTDSLPDGLVTDLVWTELRLQGTIPDTLQYLSSLTKLDFGTNELSGTIPDTLYTNLTNLEYLYLHDNQFQGTLSDTGLARLSNLKRLFLNDNRFTGPLPQNLGSAGTAATAARPLQWLNLYNNSLEGPIPLNWNLRNVFMLDLGRNQLTGSIPADWVDDMFELKILYLNHNKLSGSFPVDFPLIGNNRLWLLQVNDNQLTGVIPGGYNIRQLDLSEYQNNLFTSMDTTMCMNIVWVGGEMISMRSDCGATCPCEYFCGPNKCY